MTLFQTAAQMTGCPYNRQVAILGDSITQHNTYNVDGTSNWNASTRYGNRYIAFGYATWLRFLTYVGFDLDGASNFGVVGDTLPMILARTDAALLASNAATWFVMGGINDRGAGALTLQNSIDALTSIVNKIIAAGRLVVIFIPMPCGDANNSGNRLSATQLKRHMAFRRWIMENYASTPGVEVVDTWRYFADPNSTVGDAIIGLTYDGIHPSPAGAYAVAKAALPVVNLLFPPRFGFLLASNSDLYDATENIPGSLLSNPMMNGTAGTVGTGGSGSLADSWSGGNGGDTGHTRTYSKVVSNGFNMQQCVFAGTPTSNGDAAILLQTVSAGNLAINDVLRGVCAVEVDAGVTGIDSFRLRIVNTTGFVNAGVDGDYSGSMLYWPTEAVAGALMTPPSVIPNTTIRMELDARLKTGVACAATIRARAMGVIKVS